ncbi:MAG: hypothetical protein JSV81_05730 [Anaerolineales bacterium]|nr:MAG: hypothetical protein JSV81_05730 [Anaerolineales bacterium]
MDSVTILVPSYRIPTWKTFHYVTTTPKGQAVWKRDSACRVATWDVLKPGSADNILDLANTLYEVKERQGVVIRGELNGDKRSNIRRKGDTFISKPRRWVCIDIDDVSKKQAKNIETLISIALPTCFKGAGYVWQMSSSHGMTKLDNGSYIEGDKTWKMHLWFLTEEAHEDAVLRAFFKELWPMVDWRVFVTVQPHYIADPRFLMEADHEGNSSRVPDPFAESRWGVVDGPRVKLAGQIEQWQEAKKKVTGVRGGEAKHRPQALPDSSVSWNQDGLARLGEAALKKAIDMVFSAKGEELHKRLVVSGQLLGGLLADARTGLNRTRIINSLVAVADKDADSAKRAIRWGLDHPYDRTQDLIEAGKSGVTRTKKMKKSTFYKYTRLQTRDLVKRRYLPPIIPTRNLVLLKAPQGCGKTHWVGESGLPELRSKHPGAVVLYITHRRSMARAAATRLGLPCYLDKAGPITGDTVISVDSLHRVRLDEESRFIIVLDESEQVINHMALSGTMDGAQKLVAACAWVSVLNHAVSIVAMDADLSELTLAEIKEHAPGDLSKMDLAELIYCPPAQGASDWTYTLAEQKEWAERALLDCYEGGERVAVACQSRKQAEALALRLREIRGKVGLVTSKTILTDDGRAAMADPSGWAAQHDAIVYSPTWGTAVSIDTEGYDSIWGFGSRRVGTAMDLLQAVHRLRNPKSRHITLFAPKGGADKTTHPLEIAQEVISVASRTREIVQKYLPGVQVPTGFTPADKSMADRYGRVLGHARKWGSDGCDLREALVRLLKERGLRYTVLKDTLRKDEAALMREQNAEAREQVQSNWAKVVHEAEIMTLKEAEAIIECTTLEEAASVERAYIEDFYGDANEETVIADQDGKLRAAARAFSDLRLALDDKFQSLAWADAKSVEDSQAITSMKHRYMKATSAKYALFAAGLQDLTPDQDMDLESLIAWAMHNAEVLSLLGNPVRADIKTRAALWLSNMLRRYGLKIKASRKQRKGVRVRVYRIDQESLEHMLQVSNHYHTHRKMPGPAFTQENS